MGANEKRISFPRLVTGICVGMFGYNIALIVPLALLLTIKLVMLDPTRVTGNFSLVALIGAPVGIMGLYIGGYISDRTSWRIGRRRPWILAGAVGGAFTLYGIGVAQSLTMICLLWAVTKFITGFMMSSLYALIPDQVPEEKRGTASGMMGVVAPIAIMLGINLMLMLNSWSIENKFGLLGVICVVTAIITCFLVKEEQVTYRKSSEVLTMGQKLSRMYPSPKKHPYFTYGVITRFFMAIAYTTASYTSVYYLENFHVPQEELTGIVSTSMNITVPLLVISSMIGGLLSDKFGKQKPFIYAAGFIAAIGIVGYGFAPSIPVSYICGAILSFAFGMFLAVDIALMARILPHKEDAAKDMGIMNIANDLGAPFANAIASPIVSSGGYPLFFGVLAVFGILSAFAVKPIPEASQVETRDWNIAH